MSAASEHSPSRASIVGALQKKLAGLVKFEENELRISTGCDVLDALFPGGGVRAGMLVEWLADGPGSGAGTLAMVLARQVLKSQPGCLVVVDRWRRFYPPAAVMRGIAATDLVVVQADAVGGMSAQEELWALNQALRCPGVRVVLAWMEQIDPRSFRRLQLAAEAGTTLALLIRPASVQAHPTWSDVQLLVAPQASAASQESRFCQVTLLRQRSREGTATLEGTSVGVEIDEQQGRVEGWRRRHESRSLHLAPRVARSEGQRRSAGA